MQEARIAIVPLTDEHWPIAIDAYARFGKGRHAAGLNFGDCLTYAVASLASQPLLYVGEAFAYAGWTRPLSASVPASGRSA